VTGAIALAWSEFSAATAAQLHWAFTYAHAGRRSTLIPPLLDAWAAYPVSETRHLDSQPPSTEPTFYPVTKTLLSPLSQKSSNINRLRSAYLNCVYHPYVPFSMATLN
jgi:hypothetical protein